MTAALAVHPDDPSRRTELSPVADLVRAYAGTWFGAPAPIDKLIIGLRPVGFTAAVVRSGIRELVARELASLVMIDTEDAA